VTNSLLDAVPCSYSACYSNTIAKMAKIGINSDNVLLSYDGTYWTQKNNSSLYVKDHTITGNSYTSISKEALQPSGGIGWASGPSLWYTDNKGYYSTLNYASAFQQCTNIGWRVPLKTETTFAITNGVPPIVSSGGIGAHTYINYIANTPYPNILGWNNSGEQGYWIHDGYSLYLRCVK